MEIACREKKYKLPSNLNSFQKKLYIHLIEWKWKNITECQGKRKYKDRWIDYDAIIPNSERKDLKFIYATAREDFVIHKKTYPFRNHSYFYHIASSQLATINLFLPLLLSPKCDEVLHEVKPDFHRLATKHLYKGFRLEYWAEDVRTHTGLLGDHTKRSGTDSDIAIAYYNDKDQLCLWLIEHKLAESKFTRCGGYRSKNRDKGKHLCAKSFDDINENKSFCYYHDVRQNNYWNVTEKSRDFFKNHSTYEGCPFRTGLNQLWRNQLMGLAIEKDKGNPFEKVHFSVVKHPDNTSVDETIESYKKLTENNSKFSVLTSKDIVKAADSLQDSELNKWVKWYRDLYRV